MSKDKDWIRKTLRHEEPEAVPYHFTPTPPARRKLEQHYGTTVIEDALRLPIRMSGLKSIKPLYADPAEFGDTLTDEYGVMWTTNAIDRGAPVGPCLPEPNLTGYRFPDPTAEYRFEDLPQWCASNREHFTIIWVGDLWERATFMRGMENILLDVALRPNFVEKLLDGITEYILRTMRILLERFEFDGIALSDDYGTQKALVMSPAHWHRLIKPRLRRIYGLARKHGRTVFHHSCGHVTPIIAGMIEAGLDILHPVQPETMDIARLKREFGRGVTLCGGLGTQDLLPRGTVDEVRAEVRRLKREMGKGGGYILEPGITVQDDVPVENMLALIEEARSTG